MERNSPWTTLLNALGAVGAAVGIVYVIGGVVLSLRYEGFGLSGQQGVALASRELLFFYGGRSLVIWALLGGLLVFVLWQLPERTVKPVAERVRTPLGVGVTVVVVVALMPVLHVWWPLAAIVAVVVILMAVTYWRSRPVALFLISAAAIALVAVAYEADRLKYVVDEACVVLADGDGRACGLLVGQNDRGTYLGRPSGESYRLLFIPAERVLEASSEKRGAHVTPDRAEARRESPAGRVLGLEIR